MLAAVTFVETVQGVQLKSPTVGADMLGTFASYFTPAKPRTIREGIGLKENPASAFAKKSHALELTEIELAPL
jgi:hypothetical protein